MAKRILRISIRIVVIAFVLLVLLLFLIDRFVQFRMDDKEMNQFFTEHNTPHEIIYYPSGNKQMRCVKVGNDTSATVLFIHGAPSSASYWKNYLADTSLYHHATLYSIDRIGYGYNDFGHPQPDIHQQALSIIPVLDSLNKKHHPVIITAASYGTAIACRVAMERPDLVDGLVLVAPAIAPGEERIFWFTYIIESPLFKWFIPRMFRSANAEKIHHREELEKMLPLWGNIRVPVTYLQGAKDGLVYTTNADFAKKHLVNATSLDIQFIPEKGHLIAFSERSKITGEILKMMERCK
ncbi:MAG: alpha/beta hydrolase [Filimonas sp.]|nr:alpha/beta hydrolase [Filimonas sp.]